ncbi:MAG: tRNA uridine-5-carboxymethylaminomethyl(34) synthesis GTPase MnmE, partial [Myxococcota bacterium]|nr:tRNA uridine-5-carboxymethylaminomethyl(34) synthesis GTPase MnmE [Myxococcota bacterium]
AQTGHGLETLAEKISEKLVGELPGGARLIIASQRQRDLLIGVAHRVEEALDAHRGEAGLAVAAERLYAALEPLDAIVGRDSREAVLDALFSRFCIGK